MTFESIPWLSLMGADAVLGHQGSQDGAFTNYVTEPGLIPDDAATMRVRLILNNNSLSEHIMLDNLPGMEEKYAKWAEERRAALGLEKVGIEYANAIFFEETMNLPDEDKDRITDAAYKRAKELFKAFQSDGTASVVRKYLEDNS